MTDERKKLYIAGPMTGIPQFNFPAFGRAALAISNCSQYAAISPVELDSEDSRAAAEMNADGDPGLYEDMTGETWGDLLARDVKLIADEADGVIVLPNWNESKGARLEVTTALLCGKPVFDYDRWFHEPNQLYILPKHQVTAGDVVNALNPILPKSALKVEFDPAVPPGELFVKPASGDTHAPYSESGEVRTVSATGGEKGVKPERLDLIPPKFLDELGRVFGKGAEKYSDNNYLKGYEYRKSLGAMLRHVTRWAAGEDTDPETGCHHLGHAAWHCSTLFTFQTEGLGVDDRLHKAIEENL